MPSISASSRIGLWIGDSFAEISADPLLTTRWFHPKKSLAEGVREFLAASSLTAGEIHIATSRAEMSVARKQGTEPVLLITAGFETWARLGASKLPTPSLRASRDWFPTSSDKVFGISERITADGSVVKPLTLEELEGLASKLELLKSREIAICFLHGDRFPAHEKEAAEFFRARGLSVTCSHEVVEQAVGPATGSGEDVSVASAMSDIERVRRTVENAFAEAVIQEDLADLKAVLGDEWTIRFWSTNGPSSSTTATTVRGGTEAALAASLPTGYFFGLEEFLGFENGKSYLLAAQPTGQIGASMWPFPSWTGVDRGYEPGPLLFGKSHQLTILDVLFLRDRLKGDIEGFSDRVQAKSTARILETLFTLGKDLAEPGRRAADAKETAEDLETAFIERIAMDLSMRGYKGSVKVAGPLAPTMIPLLEKRRPDLKFMIDTKLTIATAAAAPHAVTTGKAATVATPIGDAAKSTPPATAKGATT